MSYIFYICGILFITNALSASVMRKGEFSSRKDSVANKESGFSDEASEDKPVKSKYRNGKKVVKLKSDEILEDSSEVNRDGKVVSATFELIGVIPFLASGGAIGYYIDPDNLVELSHASLSNNEVDPIH